MAMNNHLQQSMDQLGMVTNPACGQLDKEGDVFPAPVPWYHSIIISFCLNCIICLSALYHHQSQPEHFPQLRTGGAIGPHVRTPCTVCVCVCVCFLPIHSGRQVRWTYQPGSHRRKVRQDFSSTSSLRCVP